MDVITIDSSDDEKEAPVAAVAAAAKQTTQEVIALLDDSDEDEDVPKMDRKRKAHPCIEDEIIELESSTFQDDRKPAARKMTRSKRTSGGSDTPPPVIPFYLFETTSARSSPLISRESRKYFQSLREAIGLDAPNRKIQWLVISNFLVDFRYLYEKIPDIVQIPRVVIFYGSFPGSADVQYRGVQEIIMRNWKASAEKNCNSVDFVRMVPGDPPKSKTNPLPMKITYGCHHTKMFLTGFDDQVIDESGNGNTRQSMIRVVVHTANIGRSDIEFQTNGIYAQNFPLKKKVQRRAVVNPYLKTKSVGNNEDTTADKSTCSFENDMAGYLESYGYNARQSWSPQTSFGRSTDIREARLKRLGQGSAATSSSKKPAYQGGNTYDTTSTILTSQELSLPDLIRQYDYSSAYAALIPSVPGYHNGKAIHKYGYLKLRREIIDSVPSTHGLGQKNKNKKPPIVCQFSSLGSLHEKWLRKFCSALDYTSTRNTNPMDDNCASTKPLESLVKIVWPTVDEIREGEEGFAGGGSVPGRKTNLQKPFLKPLYYRWSKREFGNDPLLTARHIPHIKTIVQPSVDNKSIEWFFLSSHNLSKAAWGQVQNNKRKGGKECFISHWELGVFFSPATLLEVCGMTKPVRILPVGYGGAQNMISLCDDKDDDASNNFIDVHVPMPYNVHAPDAYDDKDEYWTVE